MLGGMSLSSENEAKSTKQKKQVLLSLQCIFTIFALSNNIMDGINANFMIKYFLLNMWKF